MYLSMPKDDEDVLVAGPDLGQGVRPFVRHHEGGVEGGLMRKGKGEDADLHLKQRDDEGFVYDVVEDRTDGPAKVTSNAYRAGWGRIFGKPVVGEA